METIENKEVIKVKILSGTEKSYIKMNLPEFEVKKDSILNPFIIF